MNADFDVVDALAGFAEDLHGEGNFAMHLHDAVKRLKEERDEARAEVERLERLFHQTHGCHYSWVEARHKTAERQREACARAIVQAKPSASAETQSVLETARFVVRATPLVTEGEP